MTTAPSSSADDQTTGDATAAAEDLDRLLVAHLDDVRGHLHLPTTGRAGAVLTWRSARPDVITPTGEVTRPPHGQADVDVRLEVTARRGRSVASWSFDAHVRAMPAEQTFEAYLFPHFVGEDTDDGESIYFAVSEGNSVQSWRMLNDGRPVLASELGERGLRDPFIIRSPEGDRFHLLATDLKVYGEGDFRRAQERGSTSLMIWESTDLVTWSEQRMVRVSSDHAGNTWAPEAIWSPELGRYVVFWASNLYPTTDPAGRSVKDSYNRMMYATTRDFRTLSAPQVWIDVQRGPGHGTIDSAVIRHGGQYYRFTKDERPDVMKVFQERSPDLLRTTHGTIGSSWDLLATEIGGETITHGEGPTAFRSNSEEKWYLFQDWPPYGGGTGYVPFETTDLDSGVWTHTADAVLPTSPRHGTVLPITAEEHRRLLASL